MASASSSSDFEPSPATTTTPIWLGSPSTNSCAVAWSNRAKVAPFAPSWPANFARPTTVNSREASSVVMETVSPTTMSPFFADARSMTTWSSAEGPAPSLRVHGDGAPSCHTPPYWGGPSPPMILPSAVEMAAVPLTSAWAEATPGTANTSSSTLASMLARRSSPNSPSMTSDERTNASVEAYALANSLSKLPLMVSVNTNTPDRNAVPAMTASAVSTRRPLRLQMFFRLSLNIGHSPKCFMRSSTRSAVGSIISSTILPSARKITRSA